MRYQIEHISRYIYSVPVQSCAMSLCLEPCTDADQSCLDFQVSTVPGTTLIEEVDAFGNTKQSFTINRMHETMEIVAHSTVDRGSSSLPCNLPGPGAWDEVRSLSGGYAYWEFMQPTPLTMPSPALRGFIEDRGISITDDPMESLLGLADTLRLGLEYLPGSTSVVSTIDHIIETGQGVCQDYAHLMLAVARLWGIPGRYVSGYLYGSKSAPRWEGTATHAWVECLLPEVGWVGFDPTNEGRIDERYVRIAAGRDYQDVAPTKGVLIGGGEGILEVSVKINRDSTSQPP